MLAPRLPFATPVFAALLGVGVMVGCSSSRRESPAVTPAPEEDAGVVDAAPPITTDAIAPPDTEPAVECREENKKIYVLSTGQRALYRFDPVALTFTKIGDLACPTSADTFSMAVDRRGTAWVEYADGRLFHVSTTDAHCTEIPFKNEQSGFTLFGMGFAQDDPPATTETLYVEGDALGRIDTTTMTLSLVASTSVGLAELTGTGNGELYAFKVSSGRVLRLDKSSGATLASYRSSAIDQNSSWAFAQWGGDFYLFTGSKVTRYSPETNTSTVVVADAGFSIVGAGSSTCAPFAPPH